MDFKNEKDIIEYAFNMGCSNCQIILTEIEKVQISLISVGVKKVKNIIRKYNIQLVYENRYINLSIESDEITDYSKLIKYAIQHCYYKVDDYQINEVFKSQLYSDVDKKKFNTDILKVALDK